MVFYATRDYYIAAEHEYESQHAGVYLTSVRNDPARQMRMFYQHESMSNDNFIVKITRNAISFQ